MRWSDRLRSWLLHAELVARGAEPLRQEALEALERGQARRARFLALSLLDELPDSPLALAIWADAAEALLLDEETAEALERLARRLPYRADVALRLAQALERLGKDPGAAWQRAVDAGDPLDAVQEARLRLLERAIDARDVVRSVALASALRGSRSPSSRVRFRLVEADLLLGDLDAARSSAGSATPELLDARGWLALARLNLGGDESAVLKALTRALILASGPQGGQVAELLSQSAARGLVGRLLPLAVSLGVADSPEWQVARALAESDPLHALEVLESHAIRQGTALARLRWLEAAMAARDPGALARALSPMFAGAPESGEAASSVNDARALRDALTASDGERLRLLDPVSGAGLAWAEELREQVYARWLMDAGKRGWELIIREAEAIAKDWLDLDALNQTASLRLDLERPLRVAVIGEFNAGKSSLINALLGQAVVPVGILPTTATVNRLRWAPDRFARVDFRDIQRPARVLDHGALAATLKEEDPAAIDSVSIFAPLEPLRHLELIDTPGFNADRAAHEAMAVAAALQAHLLLWVLDATAGLKASDARCLSLLAPEQTPIAVVVNKCDRLSESEKAEVMEHVHAGLSELKLRSLLPPVAMSAKLAQQSHAGDEQARLASGQAVLDAMIERIRESALELKAGALGRRLLRVLASLQSRQEQGYAAAVRLSARARERALSRLTRGSEALQAAWAADLEGVLGELGLELAPILDADQAAARYVADRVQRVLGERFFRLVLDSLELEGLPVTAREQLRAGLTGLARGLSVALAPDGALPGRRLAERAATLLHSETQRLLQACPPAPQSGSVPAAQSGAGHCSGTEAARWRRLEALRRVLGSWLTKPPHAPHASPPEPQPA